MLALYASGYMGISLVTQTVVTWLMYYYCPPAGSGREALLPAAAFGLVMAVGRVADAVADPIVAVASDNARTRWGRRRPFIAAGALPLVVCFVWLWHPPAGSAAVVGLFLAVMLSLLFAAQTAVACPFLALLPEVAPTPALRLRTSSLLACFYILGLVVGTGGASVMIERLGFGPMSIALGAVALISLLGPIIFIREDVLAASQRTPVWSAVRLALQNPAFRPYIGAQALFWFGFNLVLMGLPYIVTVQLNLAPSRTAPTMLVALAVAGVGLGAVSRLAAGWGKRLTLTAIMSVCLVLMAALPALGRWPPGLSPEASGMVFAAAAGMPLAGLLVLPNAMVADIAAFGQQLTGARMEALYFGIQGLVLKSMVGMSALTLGSIMDRFGYAVDSFGGVQMIGPVAALSFGLGLLVLARYPLKQ